MISKQGKATITEAWTELEEDFDISSFGLYCLSDILVQEYGLDGWSGSTTVTAKTSFQKNCSVQKIRVRTNSGTAQLNYSLWGMIAYRLRGQEGGTGGGFTYKGEIDLSLNPDFPVAVVGDLYKVSVAGKIGGTEGVLVAKDGLLICLVDSSGGSYVDEIDNWAVISLTSDEYWKSDGTSEATGDWNLGAFNFAATNLFGKILEVEKQAVFSQEVDNGNSTGTDTIDWREGNKQKIRLVGDTVLSFVKPSGACNLILKIIQDNPGNRKVTAWDSDILWIERSVPQLTPTFNSIDLVSFYFDGANFIGQIGHDAG